MTTLQALEHGDVLHNMSAPPRSTLTLQPFQPLACSTPEEQEVSTSWGLSWVLRVDLDEILRGTFPNWGGWDIAFPGSPTPGLCGALALAKERRGLPTDPWPLFDRLTEELVDELMELAPQECEVQGLPPLMMASPSGRAVRPVETDPG
jgi:hypothetical protein